MSDLYVRLSRDKFCNTLDRFWTRFARSWDVLLHGNPAADIFSGFKVASGGELGFGVGEEDWGSGEREVLEDLTHRTEGLVDVVVSRFGESVAAEEDKSSSANEVLPWMGSGNRPIATDGIIFGGTGAVERRSLRDVSLWMRQIYTYGEYAYGVRDNPLRERRKRRRRNPAAQTKPYNGSVEQPQSTSRNVNRADLRQRLQKKKLAEQEVTTDAESDLNLPKETRPEIHPRVASHDYTTTPAVDERRPNIPPPIVSAAEEALHRATRQADHDTKQGREDAEDAEESGTTLGIPDQYMKYLTFGLSTLGKPAPKQRPPASRNPSTAKLKPQPHTDHGSIKSSKPTDPADFEDDEPMMMQLEPMPDGATMKHKIARQKRQENRGHFVIGFQGELDDLDDIGDDNDADVTDGTMPDKSEGHRIILRTLHIEVVPSSTRNDSSEEDQALPRRSSLSSFDNGSERPKYFQRLRVLIYVHRPFMYCFLFEDRTSSLQYTQFYKSLHRNLLPIHRPLLSSTSEVKVAQMIESAHGATTAGSESASSSGTNRLQSKGTNSAPIFDLIYDPRVLTLHTSIPNIPDPGTPAAEGILSSLSLRSDTTAPSTWTRVDALNVHSQVLNTLTSVRNRKNEIERTSKTSRGWWVVWMKVPPSARASEPDEESTANPASNDFTITTDSALNTPPVRTPREEPPDMHRIAFLVRIASDVASASTKVSSSGSQALSSMFGNLSVGLGSREEEKTDGAGWGPAALTGGIGIDARRYVEGLLSLNR